MRRPDTGKGRGRAWSHAATSQEAQALPATGRVGCLQGSWLLTESLDGQPPAVGETASLLFKPPGCGRSSAGTWDVVTCVSEDLAAPALKTACWKMATVPWTCFSFSTLDDQSQACPLPFRPSSGAATELGPRQAGHAAGP